MSRPPDRYDPTRYQPVQMPRVRKKRFFQSGQPTAAPEPHETLDEWREVSSGSWVLPADDGDGLAATVSWQPADFRSEAGWTGVWNAPGGEAHWLAERFADAYYAMLEVQRAIRDGASSPRFKRELPGRYEWTQAKTKGGGYWRQTRNLGLVSVKQARTGSWFGVAGGGELMLAQRQPYGPPRIAWLSTRDEVVRALGALDAHAGSHSEWVLIPRPERD